MIEFPNDFPHLPPDGYSYEIQQHNKTVLSIWLRNHAAFSYTSDPVKTIWGFYNTKKRTYFAPINSRKIGEQVDINSTTPYTSMQLNLRGLESLWM
jgi:hypothetical protein